MVQLRAKWFDRDLFKRKVPSLNRRQSRHSFGEGEGAINGFVGAWHWEVVRELDRGVVEDVRTTNGNHPAFRYGGLCRSKDPA